MSKAQILRNLFKAKDLVRLVGAHNGLSAKLIEKNGFEGVWASGFEICTSFGLPDASILSMKHFLDVCTSINDATKLPVVLDADTGYGDVNNVIYLIRQLEKHDIGGLVIQDSTFPKMNSFIGNHHKLVSIEEFTNKIRAIKDHSEKGIMIFARTESFIAGFDLKETLKRATAYAETGADGIFIHSRLTNPSEVVAFVENFDYNLPIIICPTNYPSFDIEEIKKYPKIRCVIYANHGIRSQIKAMNVMLSELNKYNDLSKVEKYICSMNEAFELQEMHLLRNNLIKYSNNRK